MSNFKTYVLLDHLDSQAPIYQQINKDERVKITKQPVWSVTLRQTFQDKEGNGKTIRYKEASQFIDQGLQIEKEKLEANIGWTNNERASRHFRHGTLTTNKVRLQEYLEAHPGFISFDGFCDDFPVRSYKLLDIAKDEKNLNTELKRQIKAFNKVAVLDLEGAHKLMLKLFGSFYELPKDLEVCQNVLIQYVNECEDKELDTVLDHEENVDSETSVLVGLLLNKGLVSFNEIPNHVAVKRNGAWVKAKEISSDYDMEERMRYFLEYLTSETGKLLLNDLKGLTEKKNVVKDSSEGQTAMPINETGGGLMERTDTGEPEVAEPVKKKMGRPKKEEVNTDQPPATPNLGTDDEPESTNS